MRGGEEGFYAVYEYVGEEVREMVLWKVVFDEAGGLSVCFRGGPRVRGVAKGNEGGESCDSE